jgi:hypothetical protein
MKVESGWLSQKEIDERGRQRIAEKLTALIKGYEGSPAVAKEILRGLAAARKMEMDLRPFEDLLAERHQALPDAAA